MALNSEAEIADLRELPDPLERAKAVHLAIGRRNDEIDRLSIMRRDAIEELISADVTASKIASALGITRSRVSQLRSAGTRPERAFFGSAQLTIAIGGKPEQGRKDSASKFVVSKEALAAYELLADTARGLGLDAVAETVPPPGLVDLNRPNLIVLCSPRLLPFVGQVLASDAHLGFRQDDAGLYIVDKVTGSEYRSPRDEGESADYGYVGRLPRPDGTGTFLYIAGIHAEGTLGTARWVSDNVQSLYKELKGKRFSTLISTKFDAETGLEQTERLTPIYRQES